LLRQYRPAVAQNFGSRDPRDGLAASEREEGCREAAVSATIRENGLRLLHILALLRAESPWFGLDASDPGAIMPEISRGGGPRTTGDRASDRGDDRTEGPASRRRESIPAIAGRTRYG
jgi:hypothetical protein